MTLSRKALCVSYGTLGLIAVIGTWGNVLGLLGEHGFWGGTLKFWQDVLVNESSRFITIDILFLAMAVVVWMVLEARRLQIPYVWLYVVSGFLIAISLAFPLFMIHREIKLAAKEPGSPGGTVRLYDVIALMACGLVFTIYAGIALSL
jgi:hypothetical protein